MNMKKTTADMTSGNIPSHMLRYAIPLILGNLLQLTYNAADSIIVGRFTGSAAMASIGIANPLMNVLIYFISGACTGVAVLVAENHGAGRHQRIRSFLGTAAALGGGFFLLLSLLGMLLAVPLLQLIHTPAEILSDTVAYTRISLLGLLFVFIYNLYASALRGTGNSRIPLLFLIFSTLCNIFMDLLMVAVLGLGVRGAAAATIFSQLLSALFCIVYIRIRVPALHLAPGDIRIQPPCVSPLLSYCISAGAQKIVLMVGKVLIQGMVNPLGIHAIAAFNAVNRVDDFALEAEQSIGASITTMTAQNRGAKKGPRILRILRAGLLLELVYSCLLIVPAVHFSAPLLMSFFTREPGDPMIAAGVSYLYVMALIYWMPAMTNGMQGYVRGFGQMNLALLSTTLHLTVRVISSFFLIPRFGMPGIAYAEILGWAVMILFEYSYVWYRRHSVFAIEKPASAGAQTQV